VNRRNSVLKLQVSADSVPEGPGSFRRPLVRQDFLPPASVGQNMGRFGVVSPRPTPFQHANRSKKELGGSLTEGNSADGPNLGRPGCRNERDRREDGYRRSSNRFQRESFSSNCDRHGGKNAGIIVAGRDGSLPGNGFSHEPRPMIRHFGAASFPSAQRRGRPLDAGNSGFGSFAHQRVGEFQGFYRRRIIITAGAQNDGVQCFSI